MRDAGFIDRAYELGIASALGVYASVIAGATRKSVLGEPLEC